MSTLRSIVIAAVIALTVAGCQSSSADLTASPAPSTAAPTLAQPAASTPASSRSDTLPHSLAPPFSAAARLDCRDPIGGFAAPMEGFEAVGDVIALQSSASRPLQFGDRDPVTGRSFSKTGLFVRTGRASEIVVDADSADRMGVWWGNTGGQNPAHQLVIGPCEATQPWIVFPGGFWVTEAGCFGLTVRHDGSDEHLFVAIGAPCPGQPVAPSVGS